MFIFNFFKCMCMCMFPLRQEEDARHHRARGTGYCALPYMCCGDQTWIHWKSRKCSLQILFSNPRDSLDFRLSKEVTAYCGLQLHNSNVPFTQVKYKFIFVRLLLLKFIFHIRCNFLILWEFFILSLLMYC